jgi:hypothetical protein
MRLIPWTLPSGSEQLQLGLDSLDCPIRARFIGWSQLGLDSLDCHSWVRFTGLSQLGFESLDCQSWGWIHWTVKVRV